MKILAVDQSLDNSGIVWFDYDKSLSIVGRALLSCPYLLSGHAASLKRAQELIPLFRSYFDDMDIVIYEIPPLGNMVQRPESSLLAAMAVCVAAESVGVLSCEGVSPNKAKKFLTGSGVANKTKVREGLYQKFPEMAKHKLNQHQADAAALAVTYLFAEK